MQDRLTSPLIFISYAQEDKAYCEGFIRHMSEPIRQRMFTLWHSHNIGAGLNRENEITTHLQQASLILLLLSSDYLADNSCYRQMQQAIEIGHQKPERVCVILLRPCNWRDVTDIEQFHALPRSGRALSLWSTRDYDDIVQDIVTEIVERVTKIGQANSEDVRPTSPVRGVEPVVLTTLAKTVDKPALSRRAVLIGATSVVSIAAVGTGFVITHLQSPSPPSPTVAPHESTGTAQATIGTLPNQPFTGHTDSVWGVSWSPDGKRIASASVDKTVQIWNADDKSNVFTYQKHPDKVFGVAWSPDGKRIASCSDDNTVRVWNASNGSDVFTCQGHTGGVLGVSWEPSGKRIVSCSGDSTVRVWNASDGSPVFTCRGHTNAVGGVAWSPDGKRIASCSDDNTVRVWNAGDGSHVFTYQGHTGWVWGVSWSPSGERIVSSSADDTAQVWGASDGSDVFTYQGRADGVGGVSWSPDGKRIASGLGNKVQVWNASDGIPVSTYQGHTDSVRAVSWSPDGERIASCSNDKTVRIWQVG